MPLVTKPLTARQVATLKHGNHADGNGLYLIVKESGARSWEVRYTLPGSTKRRSIGIGAVDKPYSLAEARERAREIQKQAKFGVDVLTEKRKQKATAEAEAEAIKVGVKTFRYCADAFIRSREPFWKNSRNATQWEASLTRYVYPQLGDKPVQDITALDVLTVLQPIWLTVPETAARVRNRIELILDWAMAKDYRLHADNPARWAGKLRMLLPSPAKAKAAARRETGRDEHYRALPWKEMPTFMGLLREREGVAARALEFTILTVARTEQARSATWGEIDFDEQLWVIPGNRMKMGKEHRVPLSDRALEVLVIQKEYSEYVGSQYVFPGSDPHRAMHSNTMYMLLQCYMGFKEITVHGFRSTFRDWVADTELSGPVAENALAHTLGKVEAAYQRSKMLKQHREMLNAWARYIYTQASPDVVVPIRAARG